jgi:hypothetical protein
MGNTSLVMRALDRLPKKSPVRVHVDREKGNDEDSVLVFSASVSRLERAFSFESPERAITPCRRARPPDQGAQGAQVRYARFHSAALGGRMETGEKAVFSPSRGASTTAGSRHRLAAKLDAPSLPPIHLTKDRLKATHQPKPQVMMGREPEEGGRRVCERR